MFKVNIVVSNWFRSAPFVNDNIMFKVNSVSNKSSSSKPVSTWRSTVLSLPLKKGFLALACWPGSVGDEGKKSFMSLALCRSVQCQSLSLCRLGSSP